MNKIETLFKLSLRKNYHDGFSIIWNTDLDTIDKYIMLIILNYFYLTDYWSMMKDSCVINYPNIIIEYDYQFAYVMLSYIKGLKKEYFDCIIYEGIRPICLNNKSKTLEKFIMLSYDLNKPIIFSMYRGDLINKCKEYELNDVKKLISRNDK